MRLHVLGDFFSTEYVEMWAKIMEYLPEVHAFGYTARLDGPIAAGIAELNEAYPDRWVIRTSHREAGPGCAIVVNEKPEDPSIILCPAQTSKTEACSTCGLCWLPAAKDKTIAFLRHGNSHGGGRRATNPENLKVLHERMLASADSRGMVLNSILGMSIEFDLSQGAVIRGVRMLYASRQVRLLRSGWAHNPSIYQVFAEPQDEWPLEPALPLPTSRPRPIRLRRDPPVKTNAEPVAKRAPDAPLMTSRPHAHKRGGWGQLQTGTADQFDIGTAGERLSTLSEEDRARIEAQYGAKVPKP